MKKKFWVLIFTFLILQLADGLLTYINTPDLALEGNPLVSVWGFGWEALFIANLLMLILLFFLTYYSFVKYRTVIEPAKNRREYFSQLFYKRPDKFIWSFYKFPKRWSPFWGMLGYAIIYCAIFDRALIVCEWIAYTFGIWIPVYDDIRAKTPQNFTQIIFCLIVVIYCLLRWLNLEHKKSKAILEKEINVL